MRSTLTWQTHQMDRSTVLIIRPVMGAHRIAVGDYMHHRVEKYSSTSLFLIWKTVAAAIMRKYSTVGTSMTAS